jgi:hypothetical protein
MRAVRAGRRSLWRGGGGRRAVIFSDTRCFFLSWAKRLDVAELPMIANVMCDCIILLLVL